MRIVARLLVDKFADGKERVLDASGENGAGTARKRVSQCADCAVMPLHRVDWDRGKRACGRPFKFAVLVSSLKALAPATGFCRDLSDHSPGPDARPQIRRHGPIVSAGREN